MPVGYQEIVSEFEAAQDQMLDALAEMDLPPKVTP